MELDGYSMRPIKKTDLDLLLKWRNSPRVHERMLTDHIITRKEHLDWFEKISLESPPRVFLFLFEEKPLGHISYSWRDEENKHCSVGVYLGETRDNPLDGIMLYVLAAKYGFEILNVEKIYEEVFLDNKEALMISKYLGYKKTGVSEKACIKNGVYKDIQHLEMDYNSWAVFCKKRL